VLELKNIQVKKYMLTVESEDFWMIENREILLYKKWW